MRAKERAFVIAAAEKVEDYDLRALVRLSFAF